jgi:hypothetical protein
MADVKQVVWTTKLVNEAIEKLNDGYVLNSKMTNPFYDGIVGMRRSNLSFKMTEDEIQEYIKCKMDIHYFAETYCYVKGEEGQPIKIKLRDYQEDMFDNFNKYRFNIMCCSRQVGKSLSINQLTQTMMGSKRIGDIKIGDSIFGDDGKLTKVIGVFPQGTLDVYKLILSDGTESICSNDHLWEVEDEDGNKIVSTLREIRKKYRYDKYYIKMNNCVEYNDQLLDEDPYTYGSSLETHIPNKYKISSYKQRMELLNGIISKSGYIYSTSSFILASDVQSLCLSLGIMATINNNLDSYDVVISMDSKRREIVGVEYMGEEECICISVDNISKLFLTNYFIPTHNTVTSGIMVLHFILFNNSKNALLTANVLDTVIEILDKIKEIYQRLPFFLQQGVKNFNMKSMVLENKSRIKGFATTKTSSIGNTGDLLMMDEFAFVPDNIADKFYKSIIPTIANIDNSKIIISSTPNGFNLYSKILFDAERQDGDPQKNNFHAKRVYWYQIPKRFVTYIRLDKIKMEKFGIIKEEILKYIIEKYPSSNKDLVSIMKFSEELKKDIIHVYNNDECTEEDILRESYNDIRFIEFADITTWKRETMKDLGSEDAFNQEYDLRFTNSSRSLLSEHIIDNLLTSKKEYVWEQMFELDNKLKWSYKDLKWVSDDSIFIPLHRKNYRVIITVDLSEGLGQDYSIINIFKIVPKSREIIDSQVESYSKISDFFGLEQIGIFRSNVVSVKQLAEILYLISFEYFNEENVKIVLELNTYGSELLAHLPHVFDGNNNYGSSIFVKYKHRADATEEKIGLKVNDNKNLLIKTFQDAMTNKSILINEPTTIHEISTFVKIITNAGNITYKGEGANDDSCMTAIHSSTVLDKNFFKEICEDMLSIIDSELSMYIKEKLKLVEYSGGADYTAILNVNKMRRNAKQNRNTNNNWFGI